MAKVSTRDPETMALEHMLYLRAAHHHINVITHISAVHNCIADTLSCFQISGFWKLVPMAHTHQDTADPILHSTLQHFVYLTVALSSRLTYQLGMSSFLKFCNKYNIPPFPSSTLTLQFFCAYSSLHVTYKQVLGFD